jgi:ADP-ribose pyrophosphatase YjhB (NUDIX family)
MWCIPCGHVEYDEEIRSAARREFFPPDSLPQPMAFPTDLLVCEKLKRCLASQDLPTWLESCLAKD